MKSIGRKQQEITKMCKLRAHVLWYTVAQTPISKRRHIHRPYGWIKGRFCWTNWRNRSRVCWIKHGLNCHSFFDIFDRHLRSRLAGWSHTVGSCFPKRDVRTIACQDSMKARRAGLDWGRYERLHHSPGDMLRLSCVICDSLLALVNAGTVRIRDSPLVIAVVADGLAPNGAKPPASTALTTYTWCHSKFTGHQYSNSLTWWRYSKWPARSREISRHFER